MHTELHTETDPCTGLVQTTARLDCGLEIRAVELPGYHTAAAQLGVRCGSLHTRFLHGGRLYDTPAGTAHYLEHMMFNTRGTDTPARFAALGASVNAETSTDSTVYYFQTAQNFCESLAVLFDLIQHPVFTAGRTKRERGIITPEIKSSAADAELAVSLAVSHALFPGAFAEPEIAGTPESIKAVTPGILSLCHEAFYTPENMVLCCAGSISAGEILAVAERCMDAAPHRETAVPVPAEEPDAPPVPCTKVPMPCGGDEFALGWRSPAVPGAAGEREYRLCELGLTALTGAGSPFYARMLERGLLTEPLYCTTTETAAGFGILLGGNTPEPENLRQALLEEIAGVRENGLDTGAFENVRRAEYSFSIQQTAAPPDTAEAMLRCWLTHLSSPFAYTRMISGLTAEDAAGVLVRRLLPGQSALAYVI